MKKQYILLMVIFVSPLLYAEKTTVDISYGVLDFKGSKKKDKGRREGVKFTYENRKDRYQFSYEKTDTDTFKPPLSVNLKVAKYYVKYTKKIDKTESFFLSYATIDDNLMHQTDGGNIYGFGYGYGALKMAQYISDYKHFNVYQSEVSYTFKKQFSKLKISATFEGKYIHLQNKESNDFSKNAKTDYFTSGVKFHTHYKGYHLGAGAFWGKRVFAVMDSGFKVQHHAMEFNKTYMLGIGRHFQWGNIQFKYIYQEASEIPIDNNGVEVNNIILQLGYHF